MQSQFLKLIEYNAIVEGGEGANWYWATDQNADPKNDENTID